MKEATGELNMTVITVVAIAAVGALFTFFVWPTIQTTLMFNTACSSLDANGNYDATSATTGATQDKEGGVKCASFQCTATYNNRTVTKQCGN